MKAWMRILVVFAIAWMHAESAAQFYGPEQGLVGYWSFDRTGAGGVVEDQTVYRADGKTSGGSFSAGVRGSALKLDGRDDVVTILDSQGNVPAHLGSLGEGTISLWFKLDQVPEGKGIQPIFYLGAWTECTRMFDAANQGVILEVGHHPVHWQSKRLYFTIFANGCAVPSFCFDSWVDMEPDRWYHFAAVVGKDFNKGYLNGIPMRFINYNFGNERDSQFFEDARSANVIWIGKGFWDAETYHMDGAVDELLIYNRPLDAAEIKELYVDALTTGNPGTSHRDLPGVFPNPVSRILHLDQSLLYPRPEMIRITDPAGRVLLEAPPSHGIDVSRLEGGPYYLIVRTREGSETVFPFFKTD